MSAGAQTRYAIYYAPAAEHVLWQAGCQWLGRDPARSQDRRPAPPQRYEPWRYGFHATLKAPMRLAAGCTEAGLDEALQALAARTPAFAMPALAVDSLADFVALRPVQPLPRDHALWRLADDCVCGFDRFRAPPSSAEQVRRLGKPLDASALLRLRQWGYPHVLEGWRFHMTLSDPLPPPQRETLLQQACQHFAPALAAQPLRCTDIGLFVQAAPEQPFLLKRRYPLAA